MVTQSTIDGLAAQGTAFVKAIREGTQRMRQEMDNLGLPSPTYRINPAETILTIRNDISTRTSRPTGLANQDLVNSDEFTNLYRLLIPATKLFPSLRREQFDALVRKAAPGFNFSRAQEGVIGRLRRLFRCRAIDVQTMW